LAWFPFFEPAAALVALAGFFFVSGSTMAALGAGNWGDSLGVMAD
jgi:hypothetical protein